MHLNSGQSPASARADPWAVIFVDNSDPYADDLEIAESSAVALAQARNARWGSGSRASDADSHGLEALSAAANHDRFLYSPMAHSVSDSVSYPSPNRSRNSAMLPPPSPSISISAGSNNTNINFLLNPSHSLSPPVDPSMTPDQRNASLPTRPATLSRSMVEPKMESPAETDFEIAFLLRHYTEGPGLWCVAVPTSIPRCLANNAPQDGSVRPRNIFRLVRPCASKVKSSPQICCMRICCEATGSCQGCQGEDGWCMLSAGDHGGMA